MPSIWDIAPAGKISHGETCHVACDHYHRVEQDVALMKKLGLRSYRFSVSWPRVISDANGTINAEGLSFYDRLVDLLQSAGIEPICTLYHWDLPLWMYERGGWLNEEVASQFELSTLQRRTIRATIFPRTEGTKIPLSRPPSAPINC